MTVFITPEQFAFLASFRRFLDRLDYGAHGLGLAWREPDKEERRWFYHQLYENEWVGVGWPKEYGGLGRSSIEQWLYIEELSYRHLPFGGLTATSIGPTLIRHGTDRQKSEWMPQILRGEMECAVGYTEPDAGSDLASLRTRATREGDTYVVNGQKVFTTAAHYGSHIWLAARTGSQDSRSRGISILMVPTDSPGVEIRPIMTQAGVRTNQVFFNDVTIPASDLVGEENGGWSIISTALSYERIIPYGSVARWFDAVSDFVSTAYPNVSEHLDDSGQALAEFEAELEVASYFAERTAREVELGNVPTVEASVSKIWLSELRERVSKYVLDTVGPEGQLGVNEESAPCAGIFDYLYRLYPMMKIGGGNNEIQRNIIAQRGLGMPR